MELSDQRSAGDTYHADAVRGFVRFGLIVIVVAQAVLLENRIARRIQWRGPSMGVPLRAT